MELRHSLLPVSTALRREVSQSPSTVPDLDEGDGHNAAPHASYLTPAQGLPKPTVLPFQAYQLVLDEGDPLAEPSHVRQ